MPEKRNKYDTDPLDPDFARRAEESLWGASRPPRAEETERLPPPSVTEEQTRRFDQQPADSYPSVFVPPAYQPPRPPPAPLYGQQPFTSFGAGAHQPPATTAPPPGPSSPYAPPHAQQQGTRPSERPIAGLGLAEKYAVVLPYFPFYVGLIGSIIELAIVPRAEARTRFHAAQGLALQLAMLGLSFLFRFVTLASGSRFGGTVFGMAATVFLIVSMVRVWKGKPHHIAPLDEPGRWLGEKIAPGK